MTDTHAVDVSPYHAARIEYDRRLGSLANQVRFLRGALLIATAGASFAVWGVVRISGGPAAVPYVVEVDRLGQVAASGPVVAFRAPDRRMLASELRRFVVSLRTVYTDPVAQSDLLERGYHLTHGPARRFIDAYYSDPANNPSLLARDSIRHVDVTSILPVPRSETWKIDWRETVVPLRGGAPTLSSWQALVRVTIRSARTEEDILRNPLGIFVTDLSWTRRSDPVAVDVRSIRAVRAAGPGGAAARHVDGAAAEEP